MLSYGGWTTLVRSTQDVRTRSYFGIYEVSTRPDGSARVLTHGTTLHGIQNLEPGLETVPTSYYARRSGVGLALLARRRALRRPAADRRHRPRQRHALLLRAAQPELDLLRDRSGDGAGRAQPLHLPQPVRAAGPDRARRRPAQPRPPAGQLARHPRRRRFLVRCGADAPAHPRGARRSMAARCSAAASSSSTSPTAISI